jgi:hypothetical protein
MKKSQTDEWYEEVCQIVDTVTATADQYPEIQKTGDFLAYATVFGRIVKHIFFGALASDDVEALKNAATKVLPNQITN